MAENLSFSSRARDCPGIRGCFEVEMSVLSPKTASRGMSLLEKLRFSATLKAILGFGAQKGPRSAGALKDCRKAYCLA